VLFDVARSIRNLPKVRGDGPAAVGRALAGAEAARAQWANTQQLVGVVGAVVGERVDGAGRPRATVGV
jgi:hypothetical protein